MARMRNYHSADAETESSTDSSSGQRPITVTGYNTLPADDLLKVEGIVSGVTSGPLPGRLRCRHLAFMNNSRIDRRQLLRWPFS